MIKRFFFTALIFLSAVLAACAPKADLDIRGQWEYTLTDRGGQTYDTGTILFSGGESSGTYTEINIYKVEYKGEFSVNGKTVKLTGYEKWDGTISNTSTINGTWSHDDGTQGTFIAARK